MNDSPTPAAKLGAGIYRPLIIFFGFLLLGGALALVLFSDRIISEADSREGSGQTLLDQVTDLSQLDAGTGEKIKDSGFLEIGDRARNFTLLNLDGDEVSLKDFSGKPVILNLWATWCAPCRIEMPALQEVHEKYQQDGLAILALNQDEPLEIARAYFYDEMDLSFTPLLDQNSEVAADYGGLNVLPTTYFIDSRGIISAIHRGPMTVSQIEGYLSEMVVEGK